MGCPRWGWRGCSGCGAGLPAARRPLQLRGRAAPVAEMVKRMTAPSMHCWLSRSQPHMAPPPHPQCSSCCLGQCMARLHGVMPVAGRRRTLLLRACLAVHMTWRHACALSCLPPFPPSLHPSLLGCAEGWQRAACRVRAAATCRSRRRNRGRPSCRHSHGASARARFCNLNSSPSCAHDCWTVPQLFQA